MIQKYLNKLIYFLRRRAQSEFVPVDILNSEWKNALRGRKISVAKKNILHKDSKIFAMGSCFAVEIRNALRALNYDVYPKYELINVDKEKQKIGSLPVRDNINHYDTFLIRQEIERAMSGLHYDDNNFWELHHNKSNEKLKSPSVYQDPFRRHVYGIDKNSTIAASKAIDESINEGLEKADVVIITLGLTEVWRQKNTGLYVCMGPSGDKDEINNFIEPYLSDFNDNYENLSNVISSIFSKYPDKIIIITVSPVALNRTFTTQDVVVANMQSKSTLRTVAGEVSKKYENVFYWPSYEFAIYEDIFREDGRHVKSVNVKRIIQSFIKTYS